jgi:hypothetical protein
VCAVANSGSLSLQWVNGKKPQVQMTSVYERRLKYGILRNFVEEPVNSSSTLKKEVQGISEMLVPVYKLLRSLVPRIPQY